MTVRSTLTAVVVLALLGALAAAVHAPARAQAAAPGASQPLADEPVPTFDAGYLQSAANIQKGRDVWNIQCRHCHGNSAYPGKAPKLNPGALEPVFIFDRVTYGFKGMPAWRAVFSREERMAVVAWIKSEAFSP